MAEIINLEDRRGPLDFELPFIEPQNLPIIRKMKCSVGELVGLSYLSRLINQTKKGKDILTKENIRENTLPYNIEVHLSKMDANEAGMLATEISSLMKTLKEPGLKEELFYLRTKILISIKG